MSIRLNLLSTGGKFLNEDLPREKPQQQSLIFQQSVFSFSFTCTCILFITVLNLDVFFREVFIYWINFWSVITKKFLRDFFVCPKYKYITWTWSHKFPNILIPYKIISKQKTYNLQLLKLTYKYSVIIRDFWIQGHIIYLLPYFT